MITPQRTSRREYLAARAAAGSLLGWMSTGCTAFFDDSAMQASVERSLRNHPRDALSIESVGYFQEMCAHSDATSCSTLGVVYELGIGRAANLREAAEAYRFACQRKNVRGCANLGSLIASQAKSESDIVLARNLLETACAGGDTFGCAVLGRSYHDARLLERACESGESSACVDLGDEIAATSHDQAIPYYARACVAGVASACAALGERRIRAGSLVPVELVAKR